MAQTTVNAARLHEPGAPLRIDAVPLAGPGEDEVLVDLQFGGVNPIDRYTAEGQVAADGPLPRTLGGEAAGMLEGQPVLVTGEQLGAARNGVWAQAAVVPRAAITPVPDGVGVRDAAAMGIAGLTAWKVVDELGQVGPDDRVLVGGPDEIAHHLSQFGPTVVFDSLGDGFTPAAVDALAPRGRLVSFGVSAGAEVTFNLRDLYRKKISLLGYGGMVLGREERRAGLKRALESLAAGELRVRVDSVLPPADVDEAFARLTRREVAGKLLLDLS